MQISQDKFVSIVYKVTDQNGRELGSSEEGKPLTYIHGVIPILPGLEAALEGRSMGDQFTANINPGQAFGERNEDLVSEISHSYFPDEQVLEIGMQFRAKSESGEELTVTVTKIGDETVTVDGNHPLAGERLCFDVNIVEVRDATPEEIDLGKEGELQ